MSLPFLIQIDAQGQIVTETGRAIVDASSLSAFLGHDPINYSFSKDPISTSAIPIGSLDWIQEVSGHSISPTNIPASMCRPPFVHRTCFWCSREELQEKLASGTQRFFIKSGSGVKAFDPVLTRKIEDVPEDSIYFVSEEIEIKTEYRCFVFNGRIQDVKQYIGSWDEPLTSPQIEKIKELVSLAPLPFSACTMDFCVDAEDQIQLLEIHNFIACGLYGWDDPLKIARMSTRAWLEEQKKWQ